MTRKREPVVYMTPEEFSENIQMVFGEGAQSILARVSGISRSMIHRYSAGYPIPKYVAFIVNLCVDLRQRHYPVREPVALRTSKRASPVKRRRSAPARAQA